MQPQDMKWDKGAIRYMFVGYTISTHLWKLYNPKAPRMLVARDVVFYEKESFYRGSHEKLKIVVLRELSNLPDRLENAIIPSIVELPDSNDTGEESGSEYEA
jgi:hypothetical protein